MRKMKDMKPEEVYELLWGMEKKETRKGDIQEQESDYSNLPKDVEVKEYGREHEVRDYIRKNWEEVSSGECPRCGGSVYQSANGIYRCGECLISLWYCEDCGRFHPLTQKTCDLPCVGLTLKGRDRAVVKIREEDEWDKVWGFFDPNFDPYFLGEEVIQSDPIYKALYNELLRNGGETLFKYDHTRLNQWLREAERVWQRKTGLKTLDIHNYANSPQRDHEMTKLEREIFKYEINRFRLSRGEYQTGSKVYISSAPLIIKHFIPDENGERVITDKNGNISRYRVVIQRIERGWVFCRGGYQVREVEKPNIEALVETSA